jgi:hypothetical protein
MASSQNVLRGRCENRLPQTLGVMAMGLLNIHCENERHSKIHFSKFNWIGLIRSLPLLRVVIFLQALVFISTLLEKSVKIATKMGSLAMQE